MDIDKLDKICIIGWGKSGIGLCKLLLRLRKKIKVSESLERKEFATGLIDYFHRKGVEFEFGGHTSEYIKNSDLLVLSPGVDASRSPALKIASDYGLPSAGEVEYSCRFTRARIIGITGTNGKTTTAYLTHKVLKSRFKRVFLGGNIGIPLASFVLNTSESDLIVLELSSFQLETIQRFRPYVAALLNIEPDHFDRYRSFSDYIDAKMNIFRNQKSDDWAVVNSRLCTYDISRRTRAKVVEFSKELPNENLSCVYRIASVFGLNKTDCLKVFSSFKGLSHRMQFVREKDGIVFINDSKATNPSSTVWALKNTEGPIILIAGGKDKGLDYSQIRPHLKKVKKINVFGQASDKIRESLGSAVEIDAFGSLEEVVFSAFRQASEGDKILFSPMCSSYDMFRDYKHRGNRFIDAVQSL